MRPLNLPLVFSATTLSLLSTGWLAAQQPKPTANTVMNAQAAPVAKADTWPSHMLLVGDPTKPNVVPMGITHKQALEMAKTFYPHNEKLALRMLKNISSELGEAEKTTDAFYLSKYAVTNEQYLHYVKATGERFPFHWWKYGQIDHFLNEREKVRKAFPDLRPDERGNAPLYYWELNWKIEKIPYAVPEGQEKFPVTFVSWTDAMRYAAWAGMRLPTEVEWTLAANGGKRQDYVFGAWDKKVLKQLRLDNMRDVKLKPVGSLGKMATGPFGHLDMLGQVWEWVIPLGYEPQTDRAAFDKEYKKLRADKKYGKRLSASPHFKPEYAIAKGGSYFSFSTQDFMQARINCRAPLDIDQTVDGLGFRVAKSKRPAYDMSMARLKIEYPTVLLVGNQEPDLKGQSGIERYDLSEGGEIITNYHAVSNVPVNFFSLDSKKSDVRHLKEDLKDRPRLVSILISTEELAVPAVKPGVYGVYLRLAGMPKELVGALKAGKNELTKEAKAKARAEKAAKKAGKKKSTKKKKADDQKSKAPKERKWEPVLRKYGFTHKEVLETGILDLMKYTYVRHLGITGKDVEKRFKVSTESNLLMFRDGTGRWLSALPTKLGIGQISSAPIANTVGIVGKDVTFQFGVPTDQNQAKKDNRARQLPFTLPIQLKNDWK